MTLPIKSRRAFRGATISLLLLAAFGLGYLVSGGRGGKDLSVAAHGTHNPAVDKTDTVWTCSMHPQIRLSNPGKCPICFMDLIPAASANGGGKTAAVSLRQVTFSSQAQRLAEVTVQPVERRSVRVETRLLGKVDYDETRLGYITAWVSGRIDTLYVDSTGSVVRKGQPLASIYSPELLTAQAELIQAINAVDDLRDSPSTRTKEAARRTADAARDKLRLLGLSHEHIEEVIQKGTPSDHVTLHAPMSGVVIQKDIVEGTYVKTGARLYGIADLSRVWVVLEAYELDLPWLKMGGEVSFTIEAHPGMLFRGKVVYIDPVVDDKTRTVKVRVEVPNPHGALKPGMFVRAVKRAGTNGDLVIPVTAPLVTGTRAIVYVQVPGTVGTYEGREIVLGPRAGDYYVVKNGLTEGELVVTKGNFKIDSAVQLMAKPSMMNPDGGSATAAHQHDEKLSPDTSSAFQISRGLASDLSRLDVSYKELKEKVDAGDLARARKAYRNFYQVLSSIDSASLTGNAALMWKEYTMVLRNDATLGTEADSPAESARLFATLTRHFDRLNEYFSAHVTAVPTTLDGVPDTFKIQLGSVFDRYLVLQRVLANDDFSSAKEAARELERAVKDVNMGLLSAKAYDVGMRTLERLTGGLTQMESAATIEQLRRGFEPVSVGLSEAMARLGVQAGTPVFELYCSMAFENKGAVWLQGDQTIRNPYFGASMLQCGEVRRQL